MASTLNGKVVVKVLIDKEKYLHFLQCQKFYDEHNEKLKKELKLPKDQLEDQKVHQQDSRTLEGNPETDPQSSEQQIGTGLPNTVTKGTPSNENDGKANQFNLQISTILKNLDALGNSLKSLINPSSLPNEQEGTGDDSVATPELPNFSENIKTEDTSLLPPLVNLVPSVSKISKPGEEIEYHKGKNFDQFDLQSLVSSVPNRFQQRAANLLKAISENSEIDFDKSGNIFVKGIGISNAKIEQVFPALFSNIKKTSNIPGLREFIIALANNNLGHYVVAKRFVTGMKRPRNYVFRPDTEPLFKKFKNWWYLGN